jgi:hypothetical protein
MAKSFKNKTPMEKLTQGYEKFIKDKEIKENSRELFNKVMKKATIVKQRGSK